VCIVGMRTWLWDGRIRGSYPDGDTRFWRAVMASIDVLSQSFAGE